MRHLTINPGGIIMRTLIATIALGLGVVAPAAAAEAAPRPVTRAEVFAAAQRIAAESAAKIEAPSAGGLEEFTGGVAQVDRTSFGNYLRYGKRRQGASFALFGTTSVNGVARSFWCIGNVEVVRRANGRTRIAEDLFCPVS
jgi:hypothetical protein